MGSLDVRQGGRYIGYIVETLYFIYHAADKLVENGLTLCMRDTDFWYDL